MSSSRRLLMIGLDAADPVLVDRWIDDGSLPHLDALKTGGVHGRLRTSAMHLAGSPWPTFYTGQPPCHHGIYHDFQWRHEQMRYARPHFDWLPASPFWRLLDGGVKVVAYDVPMTLNCAGAMGVEVTGWASHDSLGPAATHPPKLITEIRERFGEWHVTPEAYGRSTVSELLALRDELRENTRRSLELATWLLQRPWDLGIVVFSALHRGGHRLWDRWSIEGSIGHDEGQAFDGALRELYVACDRAVGELVSLAGEATVIVFSLHGMMVNTTRIDLLDEMLARALHGPQGRVGKRGLTRQLGEAMPLGVRRLLTRSVPVGLRNLMMTLWSTGGTNWSATEAFTLRADLQGYVRVNLQGREPRGIVPPGDFDALCDRITEGLCSFRDAASGEPIVEEVRRSRDLFENGPRSDRLPDLIVRWKETPAGMHHALVSDRLGRIERATPGRIPNGRSGNHRPEGLLIARGPGVPAGTKLEHGADILDLAPTALDLLGLERTQGLIGKTIPLEGRGHIPV